MQESVFSMPVVVGESSIDLLGHVNNREYMRWMEAAATAHAASLGWSFDALRSAGRVWVVRQHWIEYLRPAHLGDELVVATWVESVRRLSSLRRYAVLRNGELLTVGATEWVLVDYERRTPCRSPRRCARRSGPLRLTRRFSGTWASGGWSALRRVPDSPRRPNEELWNIPSKLKMSRSATAIA